jgi:hypothetical protein
MSQAERCGTLCKPGAGPENRDGGGRETCLACERCTARRQHCTVWTFRQHIEGGVCHDHVEDALAMPAVETGHADSASHADQGEVPHLDRCALQDRPPVSSATRSERSGDHSAPRPEMPPSSLAFPAQRRPRESASDVLPGSLHRQSPPP